ncbi:Class 3 lipase [Cedratvirus A11]|uniref:Class 3 lipase n=1 Tax=Cedratvirus A11 TaxID=1903266 RepID=A0A1M7XTZ8_9VIRU|nr:Class 3 lipase [Cedratvirus A11]SHO33152.1 Class 3 lipase [Cedratvirus A11]
MSFPFSLCRFLLQIVNSLYAEKPKGIEWNSPLKLVETFSFPSFFLETEKDIGALYLDEEKNEAYLVFRGTTNYTETIIDLEFHQTEFYQKTFPLDFELVPSGGSSRSELVSEEFVSAGGNTFPPLVHCGFYKLYSYLSQKVNLALHSLQVEKIYLSGHSMGAALALLFAYALPSEYQKHVYLFACPRVGNHEFVKRVEENTHTLYNVQNEPDVVPQLPAPITLGYAYSSPGRICIFRKVKSTLVDNHHAETYLEGLSEQRLISS